MEKKTCIDCNKRFRLKKVDNACACNLVGIRCEDFLNFVVREGVGVNIGNIFAMTGQIGYYPPPPSKEKQKGKKE